MQQEASTLAKTTKITRPIRWGNPSAEELARHVNGLAEETDQIVLSTHTTQDRLRQRGFSGSDVMALLQKGAGYKLERGRGAGEWKVNLTRKVNGRDAAVSVAINASSSKVFVLTVMWLDRPM